VELPHAWRKSISGRARRLGRGGHCLQRNARSAVPPAHRVGRSARLLDRGLRKSTLTSGLNDFAWASVVVTSFPRAMLIMASAFGLWRAGLISNALFAAGVAAVVLVLLGGMMWMSGGFMAPDGVYSRFVSPIIGLVWVLVVSRVLLTRGPATRAGWFGGVCVTVEMRRSLRPTRMTRMYLEAASIERDEVVHLVQLMDIDAERFRQIEVVRRHLVLGVVAAADLAVAA
jgi:hypothetical protein